VDPTKPTKNWTQPTHESTESMNNSGWFYIGRPCLQSNLAPTARCNSLNCARSCSAVRQTEIDASSALHIQRWQRSFIFAVTSARRPLRQHAFHPTVMGLGWKCRRRNAVRSPSAEGAGPTTSNIHRVKWRHSIYGHDTIAILWVSHDIMCGVKGWRLSSYLNKIQFVGLWKCPYDH